MSNRHVKAVKRQVEYKLREGNRVQGVSADVVGDTLSDMYDRHGVLTAPILVNESRPVTAPLHPAFEWDDAKAAESYRESQARNIIRSVRVVKEQTDETTPVYVNVPNVQQAGYHPVSVVVQRIDHYAEALHGLVRQLNLIDRSIKDLKSMAESDDADPERLAKINLAIHAMAAAQSAVRALH